MSKALTRLGIMMRRYTRAGVYIFLDAVGWDALLRYVDEIETKNKEFGLQHGNAGFAQINRMARMLRELVGFINHLNDGYEWIEFNLSDDAREIVEGYRDEYLRRNGCWMFGNG